MRIADMHRVLEFGVKPPARLSESQADEFSDHLRDALGALESALYIIEEENPPAVKS